MEGEWTPGALLSKCNYYATSEHGSCTHVGSNEDQVSVSGSRESEPRGPLGSTPRPRRAHPDVEDSAASPEAVLPAAGLPVETLVPRQHGGQRLDLLVGCE